MLSNEFSTRWQVGYLPPWIPSPLHVLVAFLLGQAPFNKSQPKLWSSTLFNHGGWCPPVTGTKQRRSKILSRCECPENWLKACWIMLKLFKTWLAFTCEFTLARRETRECTVLPKLRVWQACFPKFLCSNLGVTNNTRPYTIAGKPCCVEFQLSNVNRTKKFRIDFISNQEFSKVVPFSAVCCFQFLSKATCRVNLNCGCVAWRPQNSICLQKMSFKKGGIGSWLCKGGRLT